MIPLFLGVSLFNLLCLATAATLGYLRLIYGAPYAPWHQLAGVMATLACCAVHCIVFTYFIATAKWAQHAIEVKHLNPKLAEPTRSFKAQAFPAALLAMLSVFIAAVAGVVTLSYGIKPVTHHILAIFTLVLNVAVCVIEYRAIVRNGALIDEILKACNA